MIGGTESSEIKPLCVDSWLCVITLNAQCCYFHLFRESGTEEAPKSTLNADLNFNSSASNPFFKGIGQLKLEIVILWITECYFLDGLPAS